MHRCNFSRSRIVCSRSRDRLGGLWRFVSDARHGLVADLNNAAVFDDDMASGVEQLRVQIVEIFRDADTLL